MARIASVQIFVWAAVWYNCCRESRGDFFMARRSYRRSPRHRPRLLDGEAIVSNDSGLTVFELIRHRRHGGEAVLWCSSLTARISDGCRSRRANASWTGLWAVGMRASPSHFVGDGELVYREVCKLGCEGVVSKRLGSLYRSGRSKQRLKVKNPAAPAVRRADADWGR
jgi:hypothetical protein